MENLNLRRFEQKANNKEGERRCKRVDFCWCGQRRGYIWYNVGRRWTSAGLIDRNWEDDRGNVAVIRPEKRDPNREIHWPPPSSVSPPTPSPIFFIFHRLKGSRRGWKKEEEEGVERRRKTPKRRGSLNKNRVYPGRVSLGSRVWIVSTRKKELTTAWAWRREKNRTFLM